MQFIGAQREYRIWNERFTRRDDDDQLLEEYRDRFDRFEIKVIRGRKHVKRKSMRKRETLVKLAEAMFISINHRCSVCNDLC